MPITRIMLLPIIAGLAIANVPDADAGGRVSKSSCSLKGKKLGGTFRKVTAGEDLKVRVVSAGEDLKVRKVSAGEGACGKWREVSAGESFKVRFVEAGEDLTIRYVQAGEGAN